MQVCGSQEEGCYTVPIPHPLPFSILRVLHRNPYLGREFEHIRNLTVLAESMQHRAAGDKAITMPVESLEELSRLGCKVTVNIRASTTCASGVLGQRVVE